MELLVSLVSTALQSATAMEGGSAPAARGHGRATVRIVRPVRVSQEHWDDRSDRSEDVAYREVIRKSPNGEAERLRLVEFQ